MKQSEIMKLETQAAGPLPVCDLIVILANRAKVTNGFEREFMTHVQKEVKALIQALCAVN